MDVARTTRDSKMLEIATPFVKHALDNEKEVNIQQFFAWKDEFVTSETYKSVFNIEKTYGTALMLYVSAMRSNNFQILTAAKKIFSPLFSVNNNPNYR